MRMSNGTVTFSDNEISPNAIGGSASNPIDCDKLQHLRRPGTNLGFAIGATPTTREEIVFVAATAGTIRGFHALLNDTGTSTSITFDLKKNGTTVLSSVITVVHGTGDRVVSDGTLSVTTFAADDVLSIAMTVSSSTGAQGPYAWAEIEETAAAS